MGVKILKDDPVDQMTARDYAKYHDAVASGLIVPYDNTLAIKSLEDLMNAYITFRPEDLNRNVDLERVTGEASEGERKAGEDAMFHDSAFDKALQDTLELAKNDPSSRKLIYRTIRSNPDMLEAFNSAVDETDWEEPDDWEDDNDSFEYEWPSEHKSSNWNDRLDIARELSRKRNKENRERRLKFQQEHEAEMRAKKERAEIESLKKKFEEESETWKNLTNTLKSRSL